jgi:Tol biopolymer transport system component
VSAPVWSPDGRWVACGNSSSAAILLSSPDGADRRSLPCPVKPSSTNFVLAWSRDSSTIYVASSIGGAARLDAVEVAGGRSRKIADLGEDVVFGGKYAYCLFGSMAADGKSFATSIVVRKSDLWILDGLLKPRRWWRRR